MRIRSVLNAFASSNARSMSSACCGNVKLAPNSSRAGLNDDFGAPGQSTLKIGDAIHATRSLKRSSTRRASAICAASQFMMFLPPASRRSTSPMPNSRAATSHACPKSWEISSVRIERLNGSAGARNAVRRVAAAAPSPASRVRRVIIRLSEHNSQRDLHDSWRAGRNDLSEARVHLVACRVEACGRIDRRELHLIEDVIDLPAQLQPPPRRAERDVLEKRDVRTGHAG